MVEYGFIVQTMEIKPAMEDASADEVSQAMAIGLSKIVHSTTRGIGNLPGGGSGELLSHGVTRVGGHLVVTFLYRCEKPN